MAKKRKRCKGKIISETETEAILECKFKHKWKIIKHKKKYNCWCPTCNESELEKRIRLLLESYNLDFVREFEMDELPNKRFDFMLPEHKVIIELDGKQHFEFTQYFHKFMKRFIQSQNVDRIKTRMCYELGYRLLRIDYSTQDHIEEELQKGFDSNFWLYLSNEKKYEYLNIDPPLPYIIKNCKYLVKKYELE